MLFADGLWYGMFHLDLPVMAKILRPIFVYVFLIVGVRLAGKRQLAQLNAFDLVVLLTLANTVQNAIIGDDNSVTGGLIGAATLLIINYVVVWYLYGHQRLEHLIEGDPDVLIKDGKVRGERLRQELITVSELEAAARRQGFGALTDVDKAILEPGGTLSFVGRKPEPDVMRHGEVMMRLDDVIKEIQKLAGQSPQGKPA